MPDIHTSTLSFPGHAGQPVANRFFRQPEGAKTLGVIFPGVNYSGDMPLLYYPSALLQQRGADVLQVQTRYNGAAYQSLPAAERLHWLAEDAQAAVLAGCTQGAYTRLVLVGKSIGTLALAALVSNEPGRHALTIWLTPLLKQPFVLDAVARLQAPAFLACGTGDSTYDAAAFQNIQEIPTVESALIERANHSLEIPGDLIASLEAIRQIMSGMANFLTKNLR